VSHVVVRTRTGTSPCALGGRRDDRLHLLRAQPHAGAGGGRAIHPESTTTSGALAAVLGADLIAVGGYEPVPGTDVAEVAFVVDEYYKGRGPGSVPLKHLAAMACERGIRRQNRPARREPGGWSASSSIPAIRRRPLMSTTPSTSSIRRPSGHPRPRPNRQLPLGQAGSGLGTHRPRRPPPSASDLRQQAGRLAITTARVTPRRSRGCNDAPLVLGGVDLNGHGVPSGSREPLSPSDSRWQGA
jgi:hypothetical protein